MGLPPAKAACRGLSRPLVGKTPMKGGWGSKGQAGREPIIIFFIST
ncbi:MAG: hypothetical protein PUI49_08970 [Prevotellaceae bacterium]|nr:hypothetical protein [Prevotellaceae bacterium]MDY5208811.1 hypothetical protein [Prevotella sp.]